MQVTIAEWTRRRPFRATARNGHRRVPSAGGYYGRHLGFTNHAGDVVLINQSKRKLNDNLETAPNVILKVHTTLLWFFACFGNVTLTIIVWYSKYSPVEEGGWSSHISGRFLTWFFRTLFRPTFRNGMLIGKNVRPSLFFWHFFGPKTPQIDQNDKYTISSEPMVVWRWLTPHFNRQTHFSISVSYIVC